jgi:hypothetical protein
MNKIILMALVLSFATLACKKGKDLVSTENKPDNKEMQIIKAAPIEHIYHYSCTGSCTSGEECSMTFYVQQNYIECDCEGCTLNVAVESVKGTSPPENQQELKDKLLSKYLFLKELSTFVLNKYGTNEFKLTSIELAEYGGDYYLLYDFTTLNGISESVMYALVKQTKEEPEKKYQIDCSGSCANPGETCRERFNFNPPSAECTCEGDGCTMKVIEL